MVVLTTRHIREIRRLHEEGLNGTEIAAELGLLPGAVNRHKRLMGLPRIGRNKKQHIYTVWSAETERLLAFGTVTECTKALGFANENGFYAMVSRTKAGKMKKYIVLVEPYEPERRGAQ